MIKESILNPIRSDTDYVRPKAKKRAAPSKGCLVWIVGDNPMDLKGTQPFFFVSDFDYPVPKWTGFCN